MTTPKKLSMLLCSAALVFAAAAQGDESAAYFGVKAGVLLPDIDELEEAYNAGLTVGYGRGPFAVEAEFTTTLFPGETTLPGVEWDMTTLALYGVYRSPGQVYFKLKAGAVHERLNLNASGLNLQGQESGATAGLGLGYRFDKQGRLELEYTVVEEDVSLLTLGYLF